MLQIKTDYLYFELLRVHVKIGALLLENLYKKKKKT